MKKKYCCVRGDHFMKNKNIGGVFCQFNLISKKCPNAKMRKKCKKLSNIENFHISGAANRHAPVQYAKYVFVFLLLFFLLFFF